MTEAEIETRDPDVEYPDLYSNQQIVSHRRAGTGWPISSSASIRAARDAYDRGTHEMATKRFKGFEFLLLIKRKEPTQTRNYWWHQKGRKP